MMSVFSQLIELFEHSVHIATFYHFILHSYLITIILTFFYGE